MKSEEPPSSTPKHGDVSPISGSLSNLPDGSSGETKKARKAEPTFEKLPNLSRVTPAQMSHIVFPPDGRYQPVRSVSAHTAPKNGKASKSSGGILVSSEKFAGGGGILILVDQRPDEEAEYIEFTAAVPAAAITSDRAPAPANRTPNISLDPNAPETSPPESFEVGTLQSL